MRTSTRHALRHQTLVVALIWMLPSVPVTTRADDEPTAAGTMTIDTLSADPGRVVGMQVTVPAVVDRVWGPRLFSIGKTEAERTGPSLLVLVAPPAILVVRDQAVVTISGTVRAFRSTDLSRYWGFGGARTASERVLSQAILIVADTVTEDGTSLVINAASWLTAGVPDISEPPLRDVRPLVSSRDTTLVGRAVNLRNVHVSALTSTRGSGSRPAVNRCSSPLTKRISGTDKRISLLGVVLRLPDAMRNRLGDYDAARDEAVYVYATQVRAL